MLSVKLSSFLSIKFIINICTYQHTFFHKLVNISSAHHCLQVPQTQHIHNWAFFPWNLLFSSILSWLLLLQIRELALILDYSSSFYIQFPYCKVTTLVQPLSSPCLKEVSPIHWTHNTTLLTVIRPSSSFHIINNLCLSAPFLP